MTTVAGSIHRAMTSAADMDHDGIIRSYCMGTQKTPSTIGVIAL